MTVRSSSESRDPRPGPEASRRTSLRVVNDFPTKIADFLESMTEKVRSMTVDRMARVLTFIALGLVATALVGTAIIFFLVGLMRIVGELVHKVCDCELSTEIGYAIVGGLFLVAGALFWSKRTRRPNEESS
jgi:hypothetical protein